jgi:hypothetical protein
MAKDSTPPLNTDRHLIDFVVWRETLQPSIETVLDNIFDIVRKCSIDERYNLNTSFKNILSTVRFLNHEVKIPIRESLRVHEILEILDADRDAVPKSSPGRSTLRICWGILCFAI